ncbi:MAG: hypothetical protein K2G75_04350 [Muribaculaceae bacterium]|nr:hypothetical protein [Muribaculaceae bacterium]MDE5924535.1 hypothetical protein [Muribaculaceae bacterium]MDE6330868.1 hypothetical protein [Muribaculaceae bacterium]
MTLSYSNEDDRAYGLAGMAISLAGLDALDSIVDISLDADGPMVNFSQQYYYSLSPAVSPKSVWENLIRNFHITASMVVGNVLARSMVRLHEDLPAEVEREIYSEIAAEGADSCGLEKDETEVLYRRIMSQHRRIFGNPRLHPAITELARIISRRRTLSGLELREELAYLQL